MVKTDISFPIWIRVFCFTGFSIVLLFFSSCRELVEETNYDFKPMPVINALLVEGDTMSLNISMAEKIDTFRLKFDVNAKVELYVDGSFVENLTYYKNGEFRSSKVIEASKKYTCKLFVPGFDTIFCEQFIPSKPKIIKIVHTNIAGKDEEGTSFPSIDITFQYNTHALAFYEVVIYYLQNNSSTNTRNESSLKTIVDPILLNEGLPLALFSNELISDSVYTMKINYSTNSAMSRGGGPWRTELLPLVVELRSVTEEYYRFKKQLYLYYNGLMSDGVLSSPTNNNLYSNIRNAYGVYISYNATISDTITPNTDGYYEH